MKEKVFGLVIASLVGVPALCAAGPQSTQSTTPSSPVAQTSKPHPAPQARPATTSVLNADFVSYDAKTKTMTVKDDKGQTSSTLVESRAVRELGQLHLKSGDHVMLTYRNNAKGEHQAVTDIKPAKGKA